MPKKTLADQVQDVVMSRAPHEVTNVQREKSEGMGKHSRVKAVVVDTGRLLFRVLEPGKAEAVYVSTKDIQATVTAVHSLLSRMRIPLTRVGC